MFYRIRCLVVFAGLLFFISGDLIAQTAPVPRELRFGTWVPGNIREGEEQWYSVRSIETGIVVVETSGETDTYLEAYDSLRNLIDENDDGSDGHNARIEMLAEAGKIYLFKLRGYEEESGPYQIRASFNSIRELRTDTWVSGTLKEDENHWFMIRPARTGIMIVETSGNTDTYLEAYGESGPAIAEDDDSGEGYNARLEIFAEAGKVYRIKLSDYDDGGPYQIRASIEPLPPDTERNTERSRAVTIKLGEAIPVYLRSPSESRWYRYDINRAGTQFVVQTRGSLDTILALYDAEGKLIEEDDDSGENDNALISVRLNPGTVYIEVKVYDEGMGRCTLHAETR